MSNYVSTTQNVRASTSIDNSKTMYIGAEQRISHNKADSQAIYGGVFSGVIFATFLAFLSFGASTSTNTSGISTAKQSISVVSNRNEDEVCDVEENEKENLVLEAEDLQHLFGFKTMQWAKVLKVERKTIYNWRNDPSTKLQTKAKERIAVLKAFSKEFNPLHGEYFSKFIFGKHADKNLLSAFMREPLDLEEILERYDDVYLRLDGFYKRNKMLGA
ncbi:hypothetical protein [Siccibacter turicensis]|uniref:hypothetical protein n=1 Tax=Siccibacter turicensis TaxID=357233 RepID=UPI00101EB613|nr:hypothetical protein [Siccibacter turicensis]